MGWGSGPFYDCKLNRWGDKIIACQKYCKTPLMPMQKTGLISGCNLEMIDGKDSRLKVCESLPPVPPIPPLPPMPEGPPVPIPEDELKPNPWEPWHGWPNKIEAPPIGFRALCCSNPTPRCIAMQSQQVAFSSMPSPTA